MKTHHHLSYCPHCRVPAVLCGTCGNPTCNAGYGQVDGVQCTDCPSAYKACEMWRIDPHSIRFTKKPANFKNWFEKLMDKKNEQKY